jgi:regulatory protein RepA
LGGADDPCAALCGPGVETVTTRAGDPVARVLDALTRTKCKPDRRGHATCPLCAVGRTLKVTHDGPDAKITCSKGCKQVDIVATLKLRPDDLLGVGDDHHARRSAAREAGGATEPEPPSESTNEAESGRVANVPLKDLLVRYTPAELKKTPPPREYLLKRADTGAGVLATGIVALLAAPGGRGKTMLLVELALAVATGSTWLGWTARQGRVLLALAEEDATEIQRRVHYLLCAARLMTEDGLAAIAQNLVVVPLRGHGVALTEVDANGTKALPETTRAAELRQILIEAKNAGESFSLVLLDPLARFGGVDVEKDNAAATRFVQVVETLTTPECGGPTVELVHHTRKAAGDGGDHDSADPIRGASAIVNGVRWAALVEQQRHIDGVPELLQLRVVKTNYAARPEPLVLCREPDSHGYLRVATQGEIESYSSKVPRRKDGPANVAQRAAQVTLDVLTAIQAVPMSGSEVQRKLKIGRTVALQACAELAEEGQIHRVGQKWHARAAPMASPEVAGNGDSKNGSGGSEPVPEPIRNGQKSVSVSPPLKGANRTEPISDARDQLSGGMAGSANGTTAGCSRANGPPPSEGKPAGPRSIIDVRDGESEAQAESRWYAVEAAKRIAASDRAEAGRLKRSGQLNEAKKFEESAAEAEKKARSL